jgi:cell division protein FtsB
MSPRGLRTLLVAVVGLALVTFGGSSLARVWHMKRELDGLERELAQLRADKRTLGAEIENLRTDSGIEKEARETLGLVKPNDLILKLPPSPGG